jgi:hypothetical protein
MLSEKRLKEYERLITRVRRDPRLFDEGPKSDQLDRILMKAKRNCADNWRDRFNRSIEDRLDGLGY